MFVESLLVFDLALRDFALAATPTISFVALPAISGVGFWAAWAAWVEGPSWPWASLLGQFAILVLAVYTVVVDVGSPFPQAFVAGFAGILGIIAFFWVFYLIPHRPRYRPRSALPARSTAIMAAIVTALATIIVPAIGFVQSWLQNHYLPRTSMPVVDVTTDLTPTGKTEEESNSRGK